MTLTIRKGVPTDAASAVPLILSAAYELLVSIFGDEDEEKTRAFLHHAWCKAQGQYGCQNHWVAVKDNNVVGVVTAWHTKLGSAFDRATLDSITTFYSLDESMLVLMRNQAVSVGLVPPTPHELMLGHIAVDTAHRKSGVGRFMIAHMITHARTLKKQTIVLDVQLSNIPAIRFYQRLNFSELAVNSGFVPFSLNV